MGVKVGIDCKLYHNTGTYGTPVWDEITIARDVSIAFELGEGNADSRAYAWGFSVAGLKRATLTFDLLADAAVADYDTIRDAVLARTVTDMAVADGAIATAGTKYFRGDFQFFGFTTDQPLEDTAKTPVTAKLTYSSNTPGYTTAA